MSGILQQLFSSSPGFPNGWPVAKIGAAYGGGYFAGQIMDGGVKYNLIVAPAATGQNSSGLLWATAFSTTGATSVSNGPSNTNLLNSAGFPAAYWCKQLSIGGYTDWYLPAKNELEVLYYYLKPDSTANYTLSGSNANAVAPEPVSTNYSAGSPTTTTVVAFQGAGSEAFSVAYYWSSTEYSSSNAWYQQFGDGSQYAVPKNGASYVRAVRRIAA